MLQKLGVYPTGLVRNIFVANLRYIRSKEDWILIRIVFITNAGHNFALKIEINSSIRKWVMAMLDWGEHQSGSVWTAFDKVFP